MKSSEIAKPKSQTPTHEVGIWDLVSALGFALLPAEGHARRAAPEVEVAEPDVEFIVFAGIGQRPEIAHVAPETDVIRHEPVGPGADAETELAVVHREERTR